MNNVALFAAAALAAWFGWVSWREYLRLASARARLLSGAGEVLIGATETALPSGYVKVAGTYRGVPVQIEPVVDTLNVRKLPVLWLMVTIPVPMPVRASLDLMMRASGLEVFSRFHQLQHDVKPPASFPDWATLRTDDPSNMPSPLTMAPYLQPFLAGDGKELLITPNGLRMVVLAAEAERSSYLLFREARFGALHVAPRKIAEILNSLIALKGDLEAQQGQRAS